MRRLPAVKVIWNFVWAFEILQIYVRTFEEFVLFGIFIFKAWQSFVVGTHITAAHRNQETSASLRHFELIYFNRIHLRSI